MMGLNFNKVKDDGCVIVMFIGVVIVYIIFVLLIMVFYNVVYEL